MVDDKWVDTCMISIHALLAESDFDGATAALAKL